MRREIIQEVEIPGEVEINVEGDTIIVKGKEGENRKDFIMKKIDFKKQDNKIILQNKKATKNEKKMINTIAAHIRNMIKGVQDKFEYKLKVVSSHFPITVELKDNQAIIKNFLGEKIPRIAKMPEKVEIGIDKNIITVTSCDKELAGQAAANFEKTTKIRMKDRRVFQDGIFITSKAGREM
jgi:large subunit ribosomal protein L6